MRRSTHQKRAIEQVFLKTDRPLASDEILELGRAQVESLNPATVYRNLKQLVEDGWLTRIPHPALGTLYERTGKGHHHHFHCTACNRAFDLPGCPLQHENLAPEGYVVQSHELFLEGLCPDCAA